MDLRVLQEVRYGGERHAAGSVLRDVPISTGRRLLLSGSVEVLTPAPVEIAPPGSVEIAVEAVALEAMTVAQLKQLASESGIQVEAGIKKHELIELLNRELEQAEGTQDPAEGHELPPAETRDQE